MNEPRVCVIGASHVASIMQGLKTIPDSERPSWTFFAAPGGHAIGRLEVRGGELVADDEELQGWLARTSGGHETIALDDYDAFVLFGVAFGGRYCCDTILEGYAFPGLSTFGADATVPVSRALIVAGLADWLEASPTTRLLEKLRSSGERTVLIVPEPQPTAAPPRLEQHPDGPSPTDDDLGALGRLRMEGLRDYEARRSVPVITQPEETLTENMTTLESFGRGAPRLRGGMKLDHDPDDVSHMNADFGAIRVAQLQEIIATLVSARDAGRSAAPTTPASL